MNLWVLNGPNLNLLGEREPGVYGATSLREIEEACTDLGRTLGCVVTCRQTNHEGVMIDWLHEAREGADGIVLNPGGWTHTSVALRDAIAAIRVPVVEVHLSNVHAREPFRHNSLVSPVCVGTIAGLGPLGYALAIRALSERLTTDT